MILGTVEEPRFPALDWTREGGTEGDTQDLHLLVLSTAPGSPFMPAALGEDTPVMEIARRLNPGCHS